MEDNKINRREFLTTASAGTAAVLAGGGIGTAGIVSAKATKLAALGGQPVRTKPFPKWPDPSEKLVQSMIKTTKSGNWCRIQGGADNVLQFEKKFAELMGTKFCLATGAGTQALHTALWSLGIGAGDEVLVTPYTFVASISVIFLCNALPVICDIDLESFQIDADKMVGKINENTKAIEPVHILGNAANMDKVMAVAKKHNLKVVEDACQAHLAEWNGKKLGSIGDLGCFSFQSSKVLPCGEGGAVIGNDEALMEKCFTFHNLGAPRKRKDAHYFTMLGPKYRMNEFEATVLLAQWEGLEERSVRRNENALYLSSKIKEIPGIYPQKQYDGATRGTYYVYGFRYKKEQFKDLERAKFVSALSKEGIPCSTYVDYELNKEPFIEDALNTKAFQKLYSKERLKRYREELECPNNAQLCKEIVGLDQSLLLGTKADMDDITNAIQKVYENKDVLLKA